MTVLSAQTIRELGIFTPFNERTVFNGKSYGLSYAGYDVRIAETIELTSASKGNNFSLASTVEYFEMPSDCIGLVKDKSSWARQGLSVFNTVIEPGWKGYLTLELNYTAQGDIVIEGGSPIAQIIIQRVDKIPERQYNGKYQDQRKGAQPAIFEV